MQLNRQVRLRNKEWMAAFVSVVVAFIYQVLGLCGVVPAIGEGQVVQVLGCVVNALAMVGVLMDPTTEGIGDSDRAMTYQSPRGGRWYGHRGEK